MENGHSYPSEYAWHFGERSDHPAIQHEVVDELRRHYASDWPAIWGTIWSPPRGMYGLQPFGRWTRRWQSPR